MLSSFQPYPVYLFSNWFHVRALMEAVDAMVDGTNTLGITHLFTHLVLKANTHTLQATA